MNNLIHACIHINGRIEICSDILGVGHTNFLLEWIGYAVQCKGRRPRPHAPVLAVPEIVHEMPRASDVAAPVSAHVGNMVMGIPETATYMTPCMCTCTTIRTVCMQMRMFNNLHDVQAGVHVSLYNGVQTEASSASVDTASGVLRVVPVATLRYAYDEAACGWYHASCPINILQHMYTH